MNANELADEWDAQGFSEYELERECGNKMAIMLRQQQAEIEALKDLVEVMRMGQPNIDYDKELLKPTFVGRELTDEEIVSLYESSYLQSGLDEWEFDPVYFAREILRKAQEK